MARPDEFPVVANTDTTLPAAGTDNKIQPTPTIQETGWDLGQQPAAQHFNWLFHKIYKWIEYFDSIMGTNFAKASESEAVAGNNDEKWMSPLKTKQHVDARIPVNASEAQDDTDSVSLMTPEATQWVFEKYGISYTSLKPGGTNPNALTNRGDYYLEDNGSGNLVNIPIVGGVAAVNEKVVLRVVRNGTNILQECIFLSHPNANAVGLCYRRTSTTSGSSWSSWEVDADAYVNALGVQKASTGYTYMPGGTILQWGESFLSGETVVTFPVPFPNAAFSATVTRKGPRAFQYGNETWVIDLNQVDMTLAISHQGGTVNGPVYWQAIGY